MLTTPIQSIPHFRVTNPIGEVVDYAKDLWQRKNVVLVAVPAGSDERAIEQTYAPAAADDTRLVVTSTPISGVQAPAVLIADQWGEVAHSAAAATIEELPSAEDVASWLEHVRQRCPECEGEAR